MMFLVGLVFVWALYVFPARALMMSGEPIFPVLGRQGSWVASAFMLYLVMALIAVTLSRFEDTLWPSFASFRGRIGLRTGLYRIDETGWRVSALAVVLFAATDIMLLPLGVAAFAGFWTLSRRPVEVRKVRDLREEGDPGPNEPVAAGGAGHAHEQNEGIVIRVFSWGADASDADAPINHLELSVSERTYKEFARVNPANVGGGSTRGYRRLIEKGLTAEVRNLAREIHAMALERELSSYQEASLALAFVQAVPNGPDSPEGARRYIKWPVETLYENQGDSADKTVLLAAVLRALDYPVIVVEAGGKTGVGVGGAEGIPGRFINHKGAKYYYCDPTAPGRKFGQAPEEIIGERLWVYNVDKG